MAKKIRLTAMVLVLALMLSACGTRMDKTSELLKYKDADKIKSLEAAATAFYESSGLQGLSVGVLVDGHVRFFNFGLTEENGAAITEDTRFDLGSLTQVFTGVTYGESIYRRYLSDGSELKKIFPFLSLPQWEGKDLITFGQLATHRSGFESAPGNLPREEAPYTAYSELALRRYLSTAELQTKPGSAYSPEGMDMGLLGFALEVARRTPYEQHVKNVIMYSIGMTRTTATFDPESDSHLKSWATPHSADGKQLPHEEYGALQGMAAFRSTAYDMMLFAWCHMNMPGTEDTFTKPEAEGRSVEEQLYLSSYGSDGKVISEIATVTAEMLKVQSVIERLHAGMRIAQDEHYTDGTVRLGYGYILDEMNGKDYVWQRGGDAGNAGYIGFVPQTATAVVALSNTGSDVSQLGEALLKIINGN